MKNPPIVNRYKKGISGNPKGRPKKREKEIIKLTYDIVEIYDKANKGNKIYKEDRKDKGDNRKMKKKIYLPKSIEELRKMSKDRQKELWGRYYGSEYKKQIRSLWYEIRCENRKERIKKKYMDRIKRYMEIGVSNV